jgi:hypothetical protein
MGATGECSWTEKCFVTITPIAGTNVEFAIRTNNIKFGTGAKDIEGLPLNNGGRCVKKKPEEDSEWSFDDCYFVGIQTTGNDVSVAQLFENWTAVDTTDPRSSSASTNRIRVRIAVLWTDDPDATSGAGATGSGHAAYRIVAANGYITNFEEEWDDKMLKANFKFKFAPFNLTGVANRKREDTETTGLSALANYTTSANW